MTYTNSLQGLQVHKKSGKIFIITQSYDYQFNTFNIYYQYDQH